MKLRELEDILQRRPSVSGNTFGIIALHILAATLGVVFFVLAACLITESLTGYQIILIWLTSAFGITIDDAGRTNLAMVLGISFLVLAAIFAVFTVICRMVLRRNNFIMEVEDWLYENVAKIAFPKKKVSHRK